MPGLCAVSPPDHIPRRPSRPIREQRLDIQTPIREQARSDAPRPSERTASLLVAAVPGDESRLCRRQGQTPEPETRIEPMPRLWASTPELIIDSDLHVRVVDRIIDGYAGCFGVHETDKSPRLAYANRWSPSGCVRRRVLCRSSART